MALDTLFGNFRQDATKLLTATTALTDASKNRVEVDTSGGAATVTLPPASVWAGQIITVTKVGGGTNAVTVAAATNEPALKQIGATALATMEDDSDRAAFFSDGVRVYTLAQQVGD